MFKPNIGWMFDALPKAVSGWSVGSQCGMNLRRYVSTQRNSEQVLSNTSFPLRYLAKYSSRPSSSHMPTAPVLF